MHDEILKRLEARLDRRSFLRGSGLLAAAALVGIAAASPLVVFAAPQDRQRDDKNKKKDDSDKEPKKDKREDDKRDQPDQPSEERGSTTETKLDADGNEFRECPQCGHNMYRQGRTWTCENCGYSYIE